MRTLVERRGRSYEVWGEPPATELNTVRILAGFRNAERFDPELITALKARDDLKGRTLAHPFCVHRKWTEPIVRSAVLHLLWCSHFAVSVDPTPQGDDDLDEDVDELHAEDFEQDLDDFYADALEDA